MSGEQVPEDVPMECDGGSEVSEDDQVFDLEQLQAMEAAGDVQVIAQEEGEAPPEDDDNDEQMAAPEGEVEGTDPVEMASAILRGHTKAVHCVDIHKTLPLVVSGGEDDKVYMWNIQMQSKPDEPLEVAPLKELPGHTDTVVYTAFSADGTLFATGGLDGRVILWKSDDGSHVATMEDLGDAISYLFWHPKGNIVFAGSADSQSAMWNEKGVCLQFFTGHASEVTCGALVNDSKMLATGSEDFSLKVFAPKTGELLVHFDSRGKGMYTIPAEVVTAVSSHPRVPDTVIAGYEGGSIAFLSIGSKKVLNVVPAHQHAVEQIIVSPLYPYLASCCAGENGTLIVWTAETNNITVRDSIKNTAGFVSCKWVGEHLYSADTQGVIARYEARAVSTAPNKQFTGHLDTALCLAVHEDGWIASGSDDTTVRFFHPSA
eukprot:TRINITY_DN42762_c0_g1_i1.p1 TRINITY_DN42762_c0_g1~~TRINITY_DN42762_c0_g1_i1.p1  ORF type:complete len:431 (+),score=202.61 TRINITY_DN42762_c0_g1_i1:51-1343(+)